MAGCRKLDIQHSPLRLLRFFSPPHRYFIRRRRQDLAGVMNGANCLQRRVCHGTAVRSAFPPVARLLLQRLATNPGRVGRATVDLPSSSYTRS